MTFAIFTIAVAVLIGTGYLASLNIALGQSSASAIEERLESEGRSIAAAWLLPRQDLLAQSVALLRTLGRVSFAVLFLAGLVGFGEPVVLTAGVLVASVAITTLLLWIFTSVLSAAIAEYAAIGLIAVSVPVLRVIAILTMPFNWLVALVDEAVRRLSGAHLHPPPFEDELLRSIEDTQRQGGIDPAAALLLENIVEFTGTTVSEIMTPRTEIEGLAYTDDLAAIRSVIVEGGHSRIPVYRDSLDQVVGVLYVKDFVRYLGAGDEEFQLQSILRQPIHVPDTKRVSELLKDFQRGEVHMALVIDEFGAIIGLITIEDVLEEIVGEIRDEHENEGDDEPELLRVSEHSVELDGRYRIDALNDDLNLSLPDDEGYDTIAGLVLAHFGRIPAPGETYQSDAARFTVLAATPTQVTRIRVETIETPTAADAALRERRD